MYSDSKEEFQEKLNNFKSKHSQSTDTNKVKSSRRSININPGQEPIKPNKKNLFNKLSLIKITGGLAIVAIIIGSVFLYLLHGTQVNKESSEINFRIYKENIDEALLLLERADKLKRDEEMSKVENLELLKKQVVELSAETDVKAEKVQTDINKLDTRNQQFYIRIQQASNNIYKALSIEPNSLTTHYCAMERLVKFKETNAEIESITASLGEFVNEETKGKLEQLHEKYNQLAEIIEGSLSCFKDVLIINRSSEESFQEERDKYRTLAKINLERSEAVEDIEKFNSIGKDFDTTFTVYFEKTLPLWIEQTRERSEANLQNLRSDYEIIEEEYFGIVK